MRFTNIRPYNFRNLSNKNVPIDSNINLLIGENGSGKTSFLEALYYSSYASSFRTNNDQQIITKEQPDMSVISTVLIDNLERKIKIQNSQNKKNIVVDNKSLYDRKDLLLYSPQIVVFCHSDINYITGSPQLKRYFFDQTISLVDFQYMTLLRGYKKILYQRNLVLKNRDNKLLEVYNYQLAEYGFSIQEKRIKMVEKISQIFSNKFNKFSNLSSDVNINYSPSWKNCHKMEDIIALLEKKSDTDKQAKFTTTGVHRDNFSYIIDNQDFTSIASTGQIRLASLVLKSSQAFYLKQEINKKGILLIDDVLLEMDELRKQIFLADLPDYEQIFFTFLPNENYQNYLFKDYQVIKVNNGEFK